jgi:two-component system response regulator AtoC
MSPKNRGSDDELTGNPTDLSADGLKEDESLVPSVLGRSEPAKWLRFFISRVALCKSHVLIMGPVGSGKDLVAKSVHNLSQRKYKPFVRVSCAGISGGKAEQAFLSDQKGGGSTGLSMLGLLERAKGGSLYFDEISDLPAPIQGALTEFFERDEIVIPGQDSSKSIDVRIISSTKNDLIELIRQERFREDLYYRLNVVSIHVPSLAERISDLPLLAQKFLDEANRNLGLHLEGITEQAMAVLSSYHWPGNIRQLKNVIERAAIFRQGDSIGEAEIRIALREQLSETNSNGSIQGEKGNPEPGRWGIQLSETMERIERKFIEEALQESKGIQVEAARMLGITSKNLWKKIQKHEIDTSRIARPSKVADTVSSLPMFMGRSMMMQGGRSM